MPVPVDPHMELLEDQVGEDGPCTYDFSEASEAVGPALVGWD